MAGPQRRPPGPHLPRGSISVFALNVGRKKVAGPVLPATPPSALRQHPRPNIAHRPKGSSGPVAKPATAGLAAGRHQFSSETLFRGE